MILASVDRWLSSVDSTAHAGFTKLENCQQFISEFIIVLVFVKYYFKGYIIYFTNSLDSSIIYMFAYIVTFSANSITLLHQLFILMNLVKMLGSVVVVGSQLFFFLSSILC